MIGQLAAVLGKNQINIVNMANRSKGDRAYTVVDTEVDPSSVVSSLSKIENVYKVRVIR